MCNASVMCHVTKITCEWNVTTCIHACYTCPEIASRRYRSPTGTWKFSLVDLYGAHLKRSISLKVMDTYSLIIRAHRNSRYETTRTSSFFLNEQSEYLCKASSYRRISRTILFLFRPSRNASRPSSHLSEHFIQLRHRNVILQG